MHITRRQFLKGLAAAGAVVALPALATTTDPVLVGRVGRIDGFTFVTNQPADRERLQAMLDAGDTVDGGHFVIHGPEPIVGPPGTKLLNASFEFPDGARLRLGNNSLVSGCYFHSRRPIV